MASFLKHDANEGGRRQEENLWCGLSLASRFFPLSSCVLLLASGFWVLCEPPPVSGLVCCMLLSVCAALEFCTVVTLGRASLDDGRVVATCKAHHAGADLLRTIATRFDRRRHRESLGQSIEQNPPRDSDGGSTNRSIISPVLSFTSETAKVFKELPKFARRQQLGFRPLWCPFWVESHERDGLGVRRHRADDHAPLFVAREGLR